MNRLVSPFCVVENAVPDELFPKGDQIPSLEFVQSTESPEEANQPIDVPHNDHRRYRSGLTWLAWLVILAGSGLIIVSVLASRSSEQARQFQQSELIEPIIRGKIAVGATAVGAVQPNYFREVIDKLAAEGPFQTRFAYCILANELFGAPDALEKLSNIQERANDVNAEPSETDERLAHVLKTLFEDYRLELWQAPSITDDDRSFLQDKLDWLGSLALSPPQGPPSTLRAEVVRRAALTLYVIMLLMVTVVLLILAGVAVLLTFVILFFSHRLVSRVSDQSMYGPVYAETFAIWMVLYIGGSIVFALPVLRELDLGGMALVLSLLALYWPIVRGIPLAHMREDIGLTFRTPLRDCLAGATAYVALLPILVVGLVIFGLVMTGMDQLGPPQEEFASRGGAAHPIANEVFGESRWASFAKIFFLTVVLAPLVEETFFRGILYRHLRDVSARMSRSMSVFFAAAMNSLLFAAIHPQGLLAIPLLATLAFSFSLVRQWRGSLLAPMVMHALNNSLATIGLSLVLI